jgi:hypothetical protein
VHRKTLMSILRFFHPLSYRLYLFFQFLDCFWSYQDPILESIPTQRHLTRSPIKKLKWHHLNGALIVVVVHKLGQWTRTNPNIYVGPTHTYATQPSQIGSFLQSSCLSQGHVVLNFSGVPKASWETHPKSSCKH